jgi:hypothetical protein
MVQPQAESFMNKSFKLILLVFASLVSYQIPAQSIETIRLKFRKAAENEAIAKDLLSSLQHSGNKDPLILGYLAATEALMAKHAFLPTSKYSWCKRAMNDFSNAIHMAPENLEIRYLRIAVEVNLPSLLGMSGDIKEDKTMIVLLLPRSKDSELKKNAVQLLLDNKLCSTSEESALRQINP